MGIEVNRITESEQGINAEKIFHGKMESRATELFYGESAELFADIISRYLSPGEYSLVDLGGHKGELLTDVLGRLPDYSFHSTIIDRVGGLDSGVNAEKIVTDITHVLPIESRSVDVVLLRYVLAWNNLNSQKTILKEVNRITKRIAIIQHQGADSHNPQVLKNAQMRLFSGEIPELNRSTDFLWTDPRSLELFMAESGIKFSVIQDRRIDGLSTLFIEKYGLTGVKAETVRRILQDCDYVMQTTWIIEP